MGEYKESRKFPRYPCDTGVLIRLEQGGGGFWGTLSDICTGGCYVYTFSPLPTGQAVELTIKTSGREIEVKGTVASSHPGVGMGVAFTSFVKTEGEDMLKAYIAELASRPQSSQATNVFH
jgi:hypothetical protein